MLTGKQQSVFQPLKDKAWLAYCASNKQVHVNSKGDRDRWYRQILVDNFGIFSTKEIPENKEEQFDALCLVFATKTGDEGLINYWSSAAERRAIWRLRQTMTNAKVDWRYVQGIARNMGLEGRKIEELPAELILKINTAVFIYMKRQEKKHKAVKEEQATIPF